MVAAVHNHVVDPVEQRSRVRQLLLTARCLANSASSWLAAFSDGPEERDIEPESDEATPKNSLKSRAASLSLHNDPFNHHTFSVPML